MNQAADLNTYRSDNPTEGGEFLIPVRERYPIYEGSLAHLGKLDPEEVSAVVYAYALLYGHIDNLAVMGRFERLGGIALHAIVSSSWSEILAVQNRDLSKATGDAIRALGGNPSERNRQEPEAAQSQADPGSGQ